jgi:hypothetical protein
MGDDGFLQEALTAHFRRRDPAIGEHRDNQADRNAEHQAAWRASH